jgi:uncharacterized membrane protein YgcG
VVEGVVRLKPDTQIQYEEPGWIELVFQAESLTTGDRLSETVGVRVIMDVTPYHNDALPPDVDGDGAVTPLDPLIIINHINAHGSHDLGEGEGEISGDLDVDGDGSVTPLDILIVINTINNNRSRSGSGNTGGGSGGSGDGGGGDSGGEGEGGLRSSDAYWGSYGDEEDRWKRSRRR